MANPKDDKSMSGGKEGSDPKTGTERQPGGGAQPGQRQQSPGQQPSGGQQGGQNPNRPGQQGGSESGRSSEDMQKDPGNKERPER
jgi:hypothetical protein